MPPRTKARTCLRPQNHALINPGPCSDLRLATQLSRPRLSYRRADFMLQRLPLCRRISCDVIPDGIRHRLPLQLLLAHTAGA